MIKTFTASIGIKNPDNKLPKYQQLINSLLQDIEMGELKAGERLPSINEASEECYLSRDTVERAYTELHKMGVITSIFRKGYFISDSKVKVKTKVLLLVGKITDSNKILFNTLSESLGKNYTVDMLTFGYKTKNFQETINQQLGNYHYYVILPHLVEENEDTYKTLKKIAGDRLIVLENGFSNLQHQYSKLVLSNVFNLDSVFKPHTNLFNKYEGLSLVLSDDDYLDSDIITSLRNFCATLRLDFQVLDGLEDEDFEKNQIYLSLNENDLVRTIQYAENENWQIGKDIGIISFNDSPYKSILMGGISVISLQQTEIAKKAAEGIKNMTRINEEIPISFIPRKSL
ncbi:GntR family transcriptional regulator [Sandaracinomonas limnophila]|uniref:GntR family transcriptional regulator n=1 Tax=Sandaracinomonas limnophila TaxID=1862386 RepID=A0A437PXC0_9BACT|nr:GntR family transcriptional regulator [Sandaracinomonas limnophila]RVU26914.1 GntR family transcriptional regulator [Sandaracinomonas limnophila]